MQLFNTLNSLAVKYNYDSNHNLRYLELDKLIRKYYIKDLLILGCGKGILEYILPDEVHCTSVDINKNEIEIAKGINRGKKNRVFIATDIFNLPKKYENRFQGVLVSEVIEHIENDEMILRIVAKHFRSSGGIFMLTVPNLDRLDNLINALIGRPITFMSHDHLREYRYKNINKLLYANGFKIIDIKYVYLRFPKELFVRKFITINSSLRKFILKIFPSLATYIIFVSVHKNIV